MELDPGPSSVSAGSYRDANAQPVTVDESHKEHKPTFTNNVQGVLRTKMEGGKCRCTRTKMEGGTCRCTQNQDGGGYVQVYSEPRWREAIIYKLLELKFHFIPCHFLPKPQKYDLN